MRQLGGRETPTLVLTEQEPPENTPADTDRVKYLKFPSKLLSDFHGRPMFYRAAVVLPAGFAAEEAQTSEVSKTSEVLRQLGGFGSRSTMAGWLGRGDGPKMLTLFLDGAGPYGDPYQVNSANNGPYGDALTQELIPHVGHTSEVLETSEVSDLETSEVGTLHLRRFHRWLGLACSADLLEAQTSEVSKTSEVLRQFGGCWSECPDPVDFRCYELIDIYRDANAYVNAHGFERPAKRDVNGDTIYSVRHECQVEAQTSEVSKTSEVLRQLGGRDWASWNAVFGPRGQDGLPKPLWDPKTGAIDRSVTAHWERYDLRRVVEKNWLTLGPKLSGKIHIWVGEADDYFLNNAVHYFERMTRGLRSPAFDGHIEIEVRKPHSSGWGEAQVVREMAQFVERNQPASAKTVAAAASDPCPEIVVEHRRRVRLFLSLWR